MCKKTVLCHTTGKKLRKFTSVAVSLQRAFLAGETPLVYLCYIIQTENETGSHTNF